MILNVLDFPDLPSPGLDRVSAALAAANGGDRIYLPALVPYQAPPGGWIINKGVEIFGDGPGPCDETAQYRAGTIVVPHSDGLADHVFVLVAPEPPPAIQDNNRARLEGVHIHDLAIMSRTPARGGGDGIRFVSVDTLPSPSYPSGVKHKLTLFSVHRVSISNLGGNGVQLIGSDGGPGAVNNVVIENCSVTNCGDAGISLQLAFSVAIASSRFASNLTAAALSVIGELAMTGCSFEGPAAHFTNACVWLSALSQASIDGCRFTAFGKPATSIPAAGRALFLNNIKGSATVVGCAFEVATPNRFATGIAVDNSVADAGPILIMPNRFVNVGQALLETGPSHGNWTMPQFGSPLTIAGSDAAVVSLPPATDSDNAAFGVPNVNDATANRMGALAVPILSANPTAHLTAGHLAYLLSPGSTGIDSLRLCIGGVWHDVVLS